MPEYNPFAPLEQLGTQNAADRAANQARSNQLQDFGLKDLLSQIATKNATEAATVKFGRDQATARALAASDHKKATDVQALDNRGKLAVSTQQSNSKLQEVLAGLGIAADPTGQGGQATNQPHVQNALAQILQSNLGETNANAAAKRKAAGQGPIIPPSGLPQSGPGSLPPLFSVPSTSADVKPAITSVNTVVNGNESTDGSTLTTFPQVPNRDGTNLVPAKSEVTKSRKRTKQDKVKTNNFAAQPTSNAQDQSVANSALAAHSARLGRRIQPTDTVGTITTLPDGSRFVPVWITQPNGSLKPTILQVP